MPTSKIHHRVVQAFGYLETGHNVGCLSGSVSL
jgi:hypothetical protein